MIFILHGQVIVTMLELISILKQTLSQVNLLELGLLKFQSYFNIISIILSLANTIYNSLCFEWLLSCFRFCIINSKRLQWKMDFALIIFATMYGHSKREALEIVTQHKNLTLLLLELYHETARSYSPMMWFCFLRNGHVRPRSCTKKMPRTMRTFMCRISFSVSFRDKTQALISLKKFKGSASYPFTLFLLFTIFFSSCLACQFFCLYPLYDN